MISKTYIQDIKNLEKKVNLIEYLENFTNYDDFVETSLENEVIAKWDKRNPKSLDYFIKTLSHIKDEAQEVYSKSKSSYGTTTLEDLLIKDITYLQFDINQYFSLKGNALLQKMHIQTYTKQLDDISSILDSLTYENVNKKLQDFLEKYTKAQLNHFDKSIIDSKIISILLKAIENQVLKRPNSKINLSLITKYGLDTELLHSVKNYVLEKAKNKKKDGNFASLELYENLNMNELSNPQIWNKIFEIHTIETVEVKNEEEEKKDEDATYKNEVSFSDNRIPTIGELQASYCLSSSERLKSIFNNLKNSSIKCTIGKLSLDLTGKQSYKHHSIPLTFSSFKKLVQSCDVKYTYATIDKTTGKYKDLSIEFAKLEEFPAITIKDYERIVEIEINAKELFYCNFCACRNLEKISINGVEAIPQNSFYNCSNLKSIYLNNSVKCIGRAAFAYTAIEEIIIPDSTETIAAEAFKECTKLKTAILGNSVKTIGGKAFCHTSIKEVVIPDSAETIDYYAFEKCYNLKTAILGNGVKTIGKFAFSHTAIEEISIPNSTETIGESAFEACADLRIVHLGNRIITIKNNAFASTELEEFYISGDSHVLNQYDILRIFTGSKINPKFPKRIYISDKNYWKYFDDDKVIFKIQTGLPSINVIEIIKYTIDAPVEEKDEAATVVANDINKLIEDKQITH